jgi:hypothetical protein
MDPADHLRLEALHRGCAARDLWTREDLEWVATVFIQEATFESRAYEVLVFGHRQELGRHASRLGMQGADIGEVLHDAFLSMAALRKKIGSMRPWLFTVVRNKVRDRQKSAGRTARRHLKLAAEVAHEAELAHRADPVDAMESAAGVLSIEVQMKMDGLHELLGADDVGFLLNCYSGEGKKRSWIALGEKYSETPKDLKNRHDALIDRIQRHFGKH